MNLSTLDWTLIAIYLLLSLGLGTYFARRSAGSFEQFVLSGRSLPWWLAGTSVVATTFSVDTPIYVTELVRSGGIAANWQWWCFGIGGAMGMLGVFFFSKRWRQAGIVTEVEFVELRYGGKSAAFLRGFKALYFGLIKNTLGLAALLLATLRMMKGIFGDSGGDAFLAITAIALIYTLIGGLWGVVVTDFFQFLLGMAGSIVLAFFALEAVGGISGLKEGLTSLGKSSSLSFFPDGEGSIAPLLFGIYLGVLWWANINSDGGGMFVQRMAACKNERHAVLGSLWAVMAHYALRSWPWILTALASVILLPNVSDSEAYPALMNELLPSGWKGLMVVALLAAFMSTVSTLLNWGASILVNDFYARFWRPGKMDREYRQVTQLLTVALLLLALPLVFIQQEAGVKDFIVKILALGTGYGPVLMARWFWKRINAWSEIAAMAASCLAVFLWIQFPNFQTQLTSFLGEASADHRLVAELLWASLFSALVWIPMTWLTAPVPQSILRRFEERMARSRSETKNDAILWTVGIVFLFSSLFGVGGLLLQNGWQGGIFSGLALLSGLYIAKKLRTPTA